MDARTYGKNFALASLALAFGMALFSVPARSQDSSQQSSGDAVADAARKAREQKKKDTEKPKKVYTDDDVSHSTYVGPPASGDANAAAKDGAKDGAAKGPDAARAQGKDAADKGSEPEESPETKWRKQFKAVYANLDRAQKELDILQREDNKAQLQYYTDPQKALAEQYSRKDINEKDAKIAAKKKEIDQIKQQIDDMQDALRKAGGDPGWAAP
jgi:chromosome segregation ATPase